MTATKETATTDHDLLIELKATTDQNFKYIRQDIKGLADGTHVQLNDHETRLRTIEAGYVPNTVYSPAHQALITQIDSIKKYIWMGLGIVSVLVIGINVGIRFIGKN